MLFEFTKFLGSIFFKDDERTKLLKELNLVATASMHSGNWEKVRQTCAKMHELDIKPNIHLQMAAFASKRQNNLHALRKYMEMESKMYLQANNKFCASCSLLTIARETTGHVSIDAAERATNMHGTDMYTGAHIVLSRAAVYIPEKAPEFLERARRVIFCTQEFVHMSLERTKLKTSHFRVYNNSCFNQRHLFNFGNIRGTPKYYAQVHNS